MYWKADKETSANIISHLKDWKRVMRKARELKVRVGAKDVYTSNGFTKKYVSGFVFDDASKVDRKQFCKLKNTSDGWKPRANTPLAREMERLESDCVGSIMELIGMKLFGPGATVRTPGILNVKGTVYLVLPDDVKKPRGCVRISDIEYEKATKGR